MTPEVAQGLAACIKQQPNLRVLNLNDTSLTDEGVEVVCRALVGSAPVLEELELSLNEITPAGAVAVGLALVGKPKLWRVNLRENELEDRGAVTISKALAAVRQGPARSLGCRVLDLQRLWLWFVGCSISN